MHGAGMVSGLQVVAAMALKTCCALVIDAQRNHHHGHQNHHQNQ